MPKSLGQNSEGWRRLSVPLRQIWQLGPNARIAALGACVIALILAVTLALAIARYRAELVDSGRELRTLDLLLAEETGRSLQSVSLVLDSVAEQFSFDKPTTPDDLAVRARTPATHENLRSRVAGIPQLDAISIVGSDGRLLNSSRAWPVADIHLDDRDYFKYLSIHPDAASYLTEPVINRRSGRPTVFVTRRLVASDGKLLGYVLGAIEIAYFERLYASLHLGPSDFVALWRQDGVLIARYPNAPLGQRRPSSDLLPDAVPWHGVPGISERSWRNDDGVTTTRLVASQAVTDFPVTIVIGRSKTAILADWRREVLATGFFMSLAILCLVAMFWALARRLQAYEAMTTAARERERAILAQQEAEDALRQAQKMEAVGQLTGGVAHDFNNLLTVIGSSVELLRRNHPDPDRRVRYIDAIADAAGRAAKLTAQLLAFARRQTLQPQVFDAGQNVLAISQMVDRLTGPDVTVTTVLPDAPCFVDADPNQFDTAILNMALNGRDAMDEGGELTVRVETTARIPAVEGAPERTGRFVAVSVSDTGRGIPDEMQSRVFEPFFTTKKAGQGTGLGLSQVIGFAKQSGGEVTLDSEPGRGSTFTLHLPGAIAAENPARGGHEPLEVPDGRGARIMVVDDNPEVGSVATQMLTELNYFSVLVSSAHDALDMLADDDGFAAVFSDVVMPGMDGIALGRLIRRRHAGLPILLTTGFSAALVELGSEEFPLLHKPYTLAKLAQALHEAIEAEKASGRTRPAATGADARLFG